MPIVQESPPVHIPPTAFSLAGFRRWANSPDFPTRGRISYIQGEIEVDMNADELRDHNPLKVALVTALQNIIDAEDLGVVLVDGARLINDDADIGNEPDLVFARWGTIETGKVKYVESDDGSGRCVELEGRPDLVVEVVSKYSIHKDKVQLPQAYFDGGISEYWLITPDEDGVDFQMLIRAEDQYEPVAADANGYMYSPAFGRSFCLTRENNRIGKYKYRLLSR